MSIRIGTLPEARMGDAYRVMATALQFEPPTTERRERRRDSWFADRAVVAYDGDTLVGNSGDFPFETLLPGGALVPTAGLTRVGVLPSHRRRGVLTGMITEHLRRARERGEILGSLRASEAVIYGRFGYGLAGLAASVRIDTARSRFRTPPALPGTFEVLQGTAFLTAAAAAYERCLTRPGMLRRPEWYWKVMYAQHDEEHPAVADWGVVHRDAKGRPDGFARWETVDREHWDEKGHRIQLEDLFGASTEVEAGLWRFILDLDLIHTVLADARPPDEPLRHRLVDARALSTTEVWDEQWVRVLDVAAVLGARRYATDETLTVEITADSVFADNVGRFELGNGGCTRARRAGELALPVDVLGAALLGGTSFAELAAAGRLEERKRGAVARADRLFAVPLQPFCGTFF